MEQITSFSELNVGEKVVYIYGDNKPKFMRFLTRHPRHEGYGFFVDLADQPIRVYAKELQYYFKNFTDRDLIEVKRQNALKALAECDEALKELEETGKTYKVL